jgi:hypothetical protein
LTFLFLLLFSISFLKSSPPFLSSPRFRANVARNRESDCFAKKPSDFSEIAKRPGKTYYTGITSKYLHKSSLTKIYFCEKKQKLYIYKYPRDTFSNNPSHRPNPRLIPPPPTVPGQTLTPHFTPPPPSPLLLLRAAAPHLLPCPLLPLSSFRRRPLPLSSAAAATCSCEM